jgi:hypothetical protein
MICMKFGRRKGKKDKLRMHMLKTLEAVLEALIVKIYMFSVNCICKVRIMLKNK